jgi:hypothetical protein
VERGRGRGVEGFPLLAVSEAAHRDRGVFAVGEEACCSDGLRGMWYISCCGGRRRAFSRALHFRGSLQSIASLILRHPVPGRAVGCFDGGADMCAQLWVSKAQVGGGEGLKLVVVEGRGPCPSPVPGQAVSTARDIPHAHSNAALAA